MGSFSVLHWIPVFICSLAFALYSLPTTIGIIRKCDDLLKVHFINVFFGWTVIGWAVALILALKKQTAVS